MTYESKAKLEMIDAIFAKTKLTDEEIATISGIPQEEIAKRRAQRWCRQWHHLLKRPFKPDICQAFFIHKFAVLAVSPLPYRNYPEVAVSDFAE